ncbi:MAG: 16S rRNA (guanine(966)-N(2))-methyltransferase RsmD [Candidatus Marinimicrobia bacterium]|jgi:16S rRNA (guanine966-N2)-methyltransferase|nr:16S rRNA (guanine(966)-N(2))-methyltransferase RsmD [Candidatus Neomarinimicrobiota bacterium]MDP6594152.1 16S rRNA (guanine(966)-N(2))-methyltransferase RsmD [Candidatus Neomarinimicrobiota bacterium]MDP6835630.1 16S rRNA (guanine(966)-N(2))-methyltransferase RsmD [Candidatus Neomarinimicrobiota bacterium]|tara:strand:- start:751 stop:1278 length:528 start_codon:yes stop_codon:yes gene_type:complete
MTRTAILAGSLKGVRLKVGGADDVRPTQARVRKSIFDILQTVVGEKALDLYAGSGSLGFEALSRGAASVTFVELNAKVVGVIEKNRLLFDSHKITILYSDVFRYLRSCKEEFDLIFADPPYGMVNLDLLVNLACRRLGEEGVLIVESARREEWQSDEADVRYYGDTQISLFRNVP